MVKTRIHGPVNQNRNNMGAKLNHTLKEYLEVEQNQFQSLGDSYDCIKRNAPKTILDLNDGIRFHSYELNSNDSTILNLIGFSNVNFKRNTKLVVVEFSQTGSFNCHKEKHTFGIGARMLLKIKVKGFGIGVKLDSPFQIAASMIYGKVSVSYSVVTFGIVGAQTTKLLKTGNLSEDTYSNFVTDISEIINLAYQKDSGISIKPQPMIFT